MKEEIQNLVEQVNLRVIKDYNKMDILQLSQELRGVMEFEREIFQKIEEIEMQGAESEMIHYAKVVCKNATGREISEIQEVYLKKIDTEYLKTK